MSNSPDEVLTRFGVDLETAAELAEQAAQAEAKIGIHGISVTARLTTAPGGRASRKDVELTFRVHDTKTRRDNTAQ